LACSWGHKELLKLLFDSGANPDIQDKDGMTPEMVARKGYSWQLTKISDEQRAGVIGFFDSL
ncbi:MAG: ankyrin repeat domain-containing protein, partial [Spirochaetales bacterium]|nr:ankyrin repeat domain-containing protein [Spirochaetales bacterium]